MLRYCVIGAALIASTAATGNTGFYVGSGYTVQLGATSQVQLVSEEITITLATPTTRFADQGLTLPDVSYECRFVLRNLTSQPVRVQAGMPVDFMMEQIAQEIGAPDASQAWATRYRFSAGDEKEQYHPKIARSQGTRDRDFHTFVWPMEFGPGETRELVVTYAMPMSFAGMSTERVWGASYTGIDADVVSTFMGALVVWCTYVTETGASWAGPIERATFRVRTTILDEVIAQRGFKAFLVSDAAEEVRLAELINALSTTHRFAMPDGWQSTPDGLVWVYDGFKPGPDFVVRYYADFLPRSVASLKQSLDRFNTPRSPRRKRKKLTQAREVLLATFGCPPPTKAIRAFVENQMWYHPQTKFDVENLSPEQRGMLAELDGRIASLNDSGRPDR